MGAAKRQSGGAPLVPFLSPAFRTASFLASTAGAYLFNQLPSVQTFWMRTRFTID
jgi:hypothetical protein